MENATSAKSKGILKKLKNFRADGKLVSVWLFFSVLRFEIPPSKSFCCFHNNFRFGLNQRKSLISLVLY